MKKLLLSSFAALAIVYSMYGQLTPKTIQVGTVNRNYLEYLPAGLDPSNESPSLVFILHGIGGTNSQMVSAGFNNIADTARVIVYYPQGVNNAFGSASWNNGTLLASTTDDISFFNKIIDSAIFNYNVDPSRVYITGFSMGSIMSHHMACEMNDRFAAIGCMAGTMPTSDIQNCNPVYATPVIHLHGTADGTVPYDGAALPSLSLVQETMDFWTNVHGCDATYDSIGMPNLANDGITVDRFIYSNCNPLGSVELYRMNGADHVYLYQPVNDITEMIEIWWFLNKWSHPSPAAANVNEMFANSIKMYPNPAENFLTINIQENAQYEIHQMNGAKVLSGYLSNGENQIDLNALTAGVYVVNVAGVKKRLIIL
jgi:polyhydroxybutyrate depolymerase